MSGTEDSSIFYKLCYYMGMCQEFREITMNTMIQRGGYTTFI